MQVENEILFSCITKGVLVHPAPFCKIVMVYGVLVHLICLPLIFWFSLFSFSNSYPILEHWQIKLTIIHFLAHHYFDSVFLCASKYLAIHNICISTLYFVCWIYSNSFQPRGPSAPSTPHPSYHSKTKIPKENGNLKPRGQGKERKFPTGQLKLFLP